MALVAPTCQGRAKGALDAIGAHACVASPRRHRPEEKRRPDRERACRAILSRRALRGGEFPDGRRHPQTGASSVAEGKATQALKRHAPPQTPESTSSASSPVHFLLPTLPQRRSRRPPPRVALGPTMTFDLGISVQRNKPSFQNRTMGQWDSRRDAQRRCDSHCGRYRKGGRVSFAAVFRKNEAAKQLASPVHGLTLRPVFLGNDSIPQDRKTCPSD